MQNTNLLSRSSSFTLILTILATLTGCGGGSGGGSAESSEVSTVNSSTNVVDNGSRELDDLVVNRDNNLSVISELYIQIDMSARRSYLSICPAPAGGIEVNTFDYNSCMIRATINASNNEFKLSLPNHLDNLVAILWFDDTKKEPFVSNWQRADIQGAVIDSNWRISVPD